MLRQGRKLLVATRAEVRRLFGIRENNLRRLETYVGLRPQGKEGYTHKELRELMSVVAQIRSELRS